MTLNTFRVGCVGTVKIESWVTFAQNIWNRSFSTGLIILEFEIECSQTTRTFVGALTSGTSFETDTAEFNSSDIFLEEDSVSSWGESPSSDWSSSIQVNVVLLRSETSLTLITVISLSEDGLWVENSWSSNGDTLGTSLVINKAGSFTGFTVGRAVVESEDTSTSRAAQNKSCSTNTSLNSHLASVP
jgi:hypothetical protein